MKTKPTALTWGRQRGGFALAAFFFSFSLAAAPVISPKLAAPVGIDEGALLWNELNCASCHTGSPGAGRVSPALGKDGLKITPQYLRAFLNDPESTKPGTTMPDVIHGAALARSESVEALAHFLAHAPEENDRAVAAQMGKIAQGRRLFHTVGCVACHAPEESWQAVAGTEPGAPIDPELTGQGSIPIGKLASKTTVPELANFLRDPLKYRKSGRMPSLGLSDGDAEAIAMYLLRAQASDPASATGAVKTLAGLSYDYYEGGFGGGDPDWDKMKPVASGTVDTFNVQAKKRDDQFGFRFTGLISVAAPGSYKFFVTSDDGARLWIDGKLVVDNGGEHAPQEKNGAIELTAGQHPISVTFYNADAGYEFRVLWQQPGAKRQPIPADILSHVGQPMLPLGNEPFARDAGKSEKGRALFASLGCAACHQHSDVSATALAARSYKDMKASGGCLAPEPTTAAPNFHLSASQRAALEGYLAKRNGGAPNSIDPVLQTMATLNCVACHTRDGKGGATTARLQYFVGIGEGDLGDEGRIPPHLNKVGQKLRREWMTEVLEKGAKARPYMGTRMPQFGSANVGHLPALFEKIDGSETKADSGGTPREEKFGRKLVGVGGVSCVSCHTFGNYKSLGIHAMDLSVMTKRLKKEWFHRYVIDPPALRPGTRMPSFWPNGEAVNKDILDGNTDAQINAIWAYLSRGRDADLPPGLVTGKKEIPVGDEAVIYRNFIKGAGPRAIAVGYPEKANLAFDANTLTVAEIWQGAFMDDARHSSGRGEGFEPPLGDRIVQLAPGAPLAILAGPDAPWPTATGHAAAYQMRGYRLDDKQRPAFRYTFGLIEVEDFPIAMPGEIDPYFKRTFAFKNAGAAAPQNLWLRAAVGDKIEPQADKSFVVDGRVTFKLTGATAVVRQSGGKSELLVPVSMQNGQAQIVEEIRW